ncbi:MAG: hypothetical protein JXR36_10015 [Bacteroidales bacterium]|nr:hypothetical protein [Bacteroidales bacterium]
MKNITTIILAIVLSSISFSALAQGKGHKPYGMNDEKIKAEKVAFITDKIDLSVEEAQSFWPLYNEFNDKMSSLFEEEHSIYHSIKKDYESISDTDLTKKLDRMLEINKEKSELEIEYHNKYKKILPPKKIAKLYQADKDFRKHLMHKYKGGSPE